MTLFACLQAAAFVGPLTYPQQPETPQDGGVCVSTYMWVCVCVKPSANKPQEWRNRPVPSSIYRSHDIIHNLGAQYIRSLRGGAITGGEGGLNFSVSVYNAVLYVGIPVVWGPAGAAPKVAAAGRS